MEYLIGAAITIVAYIVTNILARKEKDVTDIAIKYSQSHIWSLMSPLISLSETEEINTPRQSEEFLRQRYTRIMVVKNKAYWIKNNSFYVADVVNGTVNHDNARVVDTMSMSKVELDEMMFIVEKLREDDNDSRDTGK